MSARGMTVKVFSHPAKTQVLAAVLCLAAAASAWGNTSSLLRAPLGFVVTGFIPGWLLAGILFRDGASTPEERGMTAVVFSVPITVLARVTAGGLALSGVDFIVAWALVCAAGSILIPRKAERHKTPDFVAWLLATALVLAVVTPAAVNPPIRFWGDAMFHAQVVGEVLPRTFPAEDPAYSGMPLTYCWVFHVWAAALVDAMGVTPYAVFPWISGAMMLALALGTYRLASIYWTQRLSRRLAPIVVVLGMNSLGWLGFVVRSSLSVFVGERRGVIELAEAFDAMLGHPTANSVTGALIFSPQYPLSSFAFKYLCANAVATGLTLIVAGLVLASRFLKEGGRRKLVALGLTVVTAIVIHPVVGIPASGGFLVGYTITCLSKSIRYRSLQGIAAVVLASVLAAPIVASMSGTQLSRSETAAISLVSNNLSALIQGVGLIIIPSLWGYWTLRRRQAAIADFAGGFALTALAATVLLRLPLRCDIYTVYLGYLALAVFAPGGVAAAVSELRNRGRGMLALVLVGLVFLLSFILLVQGFARDGRTPGFYGYPETPDEIVVFNYLRDQSPTDAVVVDSRVSHYPPCSAYARRRAFYGGYVWAEALGYPKREMIRRERAVVNLFFERGVSDSTCSALEDTKRPVYIVARDYTPVKTKLRNLPDPSMTNPIGKLESLSDLLEPVVRTSSIVLFRWKGHPQAQPEPNAVALQAPHK